MSGCLDVTAPPRSKVVCVTRRHLAAGITGAVFLGAVLSRSVWYPAALFHPDESTALWMALDAVRHPHVPDHGLVSSYHVLQPPGLVGLTMPFVALRRRSPRVRDHRVCLPERSGNRTARRNRRSLLGPRVCSGAGIVPDRRPGCVLLGVGVASEPLHGSDGANAGSRYTPA